MGCQVKRLALRPWYLGSFYAHLDECSNNITWSLGQYNVMNYADVNFLQLFLWERFRAISSMPREFNTVKPQLVDEVKKIKISHLKS